MCHVALSYNAHLRQQNAIICICVLTGYANACIIKNENCNCINYPKEVMRLNSGIRTKLCCEDCLAELMPWEECYSWQEGKKRIIVCADCFEALFDELTLSEKARLAGSDVFVAGELCGCSQR